MRYWITLAYLLSACGCGYVPLRTARALGVQHVLVLPPRELEPTGIAGSYSEELRRRLAAEGFRLTVAQDAADAILSGRVLSTSSGPLPNATVTAFSVRVQLEAELRRVNGELLWSARFTEAEEFLPESNDARGLLATEANRRRALARLTERLAARVVRDIQRASL